MSTVRFSILSAALATLSLTFAPVWAQDDLMLGISNARQAGNDLYVVQTGDIVKLRIGSSTHSGRLAVYGFLPARDSATLNLSAIALLASETVAAGDEVSFKFLIDAQVDGLGASLLAVLWDGNGVGHASNLLTIYVNALPASRPPIDTVPAADIAPKPANAKSPSDQARTTPRERVASDHGACSDVRGSRDDVDGRLLVV